MRPVTGQMMREMLGRNVLTCGEKRREVCIVKDSIAEVEDIIGCRGCTDMAPIETAYWSTSSAERRARPFF